MMLKTLSLLLLLQGTSAMTIKIHSVACKEEAISVTFDKICSDNNTCTIGKQSNLDGTCK
jgi:hypothetical protein